MKFLQALLFTCFCFSYSAVFSQVEQDSLLSLDFDRSIKLVNENKLKEAVVIWEDILDNAPDSSKYFGMSANNLSYYYFMKDDIDKVKFYYELIVSSNLRDDELNKDDIMFPFANYRYKANSRLLNILVKKGHYKEALELIKDVEKGGRASYKAFSSTNFLIRKIDVLFNKVYVLKKIGEKEEARKLLIQASINDDYYCLKEDWAIYSGSAMKMYHEEIVTKLLSNLEEDNLLENCEKSFKEAMNNYTENKIRDGQYEIHLKILEHECAYIMCVDENQEKPTKKVVKKSLLSGQFYQMLLAKLKNENE